jgi:Fungal specific transcription factor domain
MLEVFDSIGALTLAIDFHLEDKPFEGVIHRTRTAIQHKLLTLPAVDELNFPEGDAETPPNVYECCRLTAMIYSVAVVYPVPNSYDLLQELVKRLKTAIEVLDVYNRDLDGILLWILVLGGIAALDKPERPWFTSQLHLLSRRIGVADWDTVEDKLESFLWLDSACGSGGQMLWDEIGPDSTPSELSNL